MEVQSWVELANNPAPTASGSAFASATTATVISPNSSTNPAFTIPANRLFPGAAILWVANGQFSTTGTPTLNLGVYSGGAGGTALATTGTVTTNSTASSQTWTSTGIIVCRLIGTSGTLFAAGHAANINSTTAGIVPMPASSPAAVTVDTTAAKTLDFVAAWGTSSASNTIQLHNWAIIPLNVNLT